MRILFVAPRFHTNQYQVVKTLQEEKHDVFFHVAFIGPTEDHSLLTPINYRQSYFSRIMEKTFGNGGVKRPYYFPGFSNYWKAFQELKPDLVIIRDPYKYFSLLAAFSAFFLGTRIVFYTQEELYRPRKKITFLKQSLTNKFFQAAWMTPIMGHPNSKTNKPAHMFFVPLPIPLQPFNKIKREITVGIPKILMIGKFHQERKKHLLLIKALDLLGKKYNFKATFVGECETTEQVKKYNELEVIIQQMRLSDTIRLEKNIPFQNMEKLYISHHIFVLPAVNEQYGVSITEAMSHGMPVICTDTCGARFNIHNGINGYIIKSGSLEELTAALELLLSDKEKLRQMSVSSYEYVHENLSGNAFYEKFSHLLNDRFLLSALPQPVFRT